MLCKNNETAKAHSPQRYASAYTARSGGARAPKDARTRMLYDSDKSEPELFFISYALWRNNALQGTHTPLTDNGGTRKEHKGETQDVARKSSLVLVSKLGFLVSFSLLCVGVCLSPWGFCLGSLSFKWNLCVSIVCECRHWRWPWWAFLHQGRLMGLHWH